MTYTPAFFDQISEGSLRSAEVVMPLALEATGARSVIDVGCGSAAWAAVAGRLGATVVGVDGHVPPDGLLIEPEDFRRVDLASGTVDCSGFDLAVCLEVAEHLPPEAAPALVASLCGARHVLFSAAIPGQGGVGHLNEQWGSWWARLFAEHGYVGSCDLRWRIWNDARVENWYRQNLIVFAPGDGPGQVIDAIHPARVGGWVEP